jgi:type VI secretion system protein ImpA
LAFIEIDKLLKGISPDDPCGPDLEYDADFVALMQAAEGKPPKYTPDGQLVEEAEDPNWREIKEQCVAMFDRTIDLRVAMLLVNALMCQHGLPGLRDGLALLKGLLEQHWDHFHPQLDPDDGNDPLMRMNLIAALAAPVGADGDPMRFQQRLRDIPLAQSRQLGRFTLRDLMIAAGDLPPPQGGEPPANEGIIEAAFRDTDADELRRTGEAAGESAGISRELDQWLTTKIGASNAADLSSWHAMLGDLNKRLSQRITARFPGETVDDHAEPGSGDDATGEVNPEPSGVHRAGGSPLSGGVHSREDVLRALNKVLEYYSSYEPSSPVPMLLRRAQRLVTMDFVDIIRELSPSALDQLRVIGGEDALQSTGPVSTEAPPRQESMSGTRSGDIPAPPSPSVAGGGSSTAGGDEPVRLSASDFAPRG